MFFSERGDQETEASAGYLKARDCNRGLGKVPHHERDQIQVSVQEEESVRGHDRRDAVCLTNVGDVSRFCLVSMDEKIKKLYSFSRRRRFPTASGVPLSANALCDRRKPLKRDTTSTVNVDRCANDQTNREFDVQTCCHVGCELSWNRRRSSPHLVAQHHSDRLVNMLTSPTMSMAAPRSCLPRPSANAKAVACVSGRVGSRQGVRNRVKVVQCAGTDLRASVFSVSRRHARGRGRASLVVHASDDGSQPPKKSSLPKEKFSNATKMRSEAQAPFRVARMFFFGAFGANAGLGFGIASLQTVTKVLGAPNGPPLDQSLQNMAINLACALFFGFLYKRDVEGRDRQMSRISREERLSNLKVTLAGGKVVSLYDLRGFARVVVVAGNKHYCDAAVQNAEQFREQLIERGVLLVPVVVDGGSSEFQFADDLDPLDRRFRARPVSFDKWQRWLDEQKAEAKIGDDTGVYVGLRMDGRVRSSGKGAAPFERFVSELPKTDGAFGGFGDGFDGSVGVDT